MRLIKSIKLSFTTWVLAAILNSFISGIYLSLFVEAFNSWPGMGFLVLFFSLLFSAPFMFVFWIVLLANWNKGELFRLLLRTGFVLAPLSSLFLYFISPRLTSDQQLFLSASILVAAIASIMMHRTVIISITKRNTMQSMYKLMVGVRSRSLVFLTHNMALPILKVIRAPERFPYTRDDLHQFSAGSLGKDLVTMLESKQLDLLPYYAKHDIKHLLLEYDTTDEGEACLQFFMLGNGHFSFPVIATVLFGLLTMPEFGNSFRKAYLRGRKSNSLSGVDWFTLLGQSTVSLRDKVTNQQASPNV